MMIIDEEEESGGSQNSTSKPKEKKKKKKQVVSRKEFLRFQYKIDQILAAVKSSQPQPNYVPGP